MPGGVQVRLRLLSRGLRAVKFLLRNRVLLPQFLVALKIRLRARRGGGRRGGVGLGFLSDGLGGRHLRAHQLQPGEREFVARFLRVRRGLLLRHRHRVIRRVNFHQQFVREDKLVVQNVDREHLARNPGRDGNDVALNKRVVGGFVRQKTVEIRQRKIQQHGEYRRCRPKEPAANSAGPILRRCPSGLRTADWRWMDCRS